MIIRLNRQRVNVLLRAVRDGIDWQDTLADVYKDPFSDKIGGFGKECIKERDKYKRLKKEIHRQVKHVEERA